ncbi:hypothetical protein [Planobispora rosea]|uniref:hypothetical protein n=1 Tax=Planobispora rosea TaxID=35762 RepID=UPI00083A062B|nr:hypothetical protein [Planobispora rosea]
MTHQVQRIVHRITNDKAIEICEIWAIGERAEWGRSVPPRGAVRARRSVHRLSEVEALSDAAELEVDTTAQEVIAGWRATVRIKADPVRYAQARKATSGDFGPVEVTA